VAKNDEEIRAYLKQVDSRYQRIIEELAGIKDRLLAIEKRNKLQDSSRRSAAMISDREARLGEYRADTLTPALRDTYDIVENLTHNPGQWVSLEDIVGKSQRAKQTESAYVKTLHREGYLERKSNIVGTPSGRRVRRLVYRTSK
jgi:hypothetical protein